MLNLRIEGKQWSEYDFADDNIQGLEIGFRKRSFRPLIFRKRTSVLYDTPSGDNLNA